MREERMQLKNKRGKFQLPAWLLVLFTAMITLNMPFSVPASLIFSQQSSSTSLTPIIHAEESRTEKKVLKKPTPNAQFLQKQWNLNLMNIGEAWADGYTGKGIKIAVLDTGFFHNHPDSVLTGGDSVFSDDPWSNDHSGHGTHIAGIISAKSGSAYQGVAPGAEVYGIKIYHKDDMNEFGDVSTDVSSVVKGIQLAIEKKVDIIVISSGLRYHDENLHQVIKQAHQQNIMIIAASGNGNSAVNYPASYNEVIAVTAVDEDLNPALDIIYGKENELSAPGVNIGGLSIPDSSYSYPYIYMSGSSQATPHVAGLAAILMQKYNARGEKIRKIMQDQAVPIGEAGLFGHGLVYYQSDETQNPDNENPAAPSEPSAPEPGKEDNNENEADETEARKPASSREAAPDDAATDEELTAYRKIKVRFEEGQAATIEGDGFPGIEMGGLLDVFMRGAKSLRLNESQIADIRQKNLTLVLRQEGISWKIPPANFVPGQANLRFYQGQPTGTPVNPDYYSNIYTVSIFQARTRQGIYPGWMEVRFDVNRQKMPEPSQLKAAYFDNEQTKWLPLEQSVKDGNKLVLKTKHTGAVGFFEADPNLALAPKTKNVAAPPASLLVVVLAAVSVIFLALMIRRLISKFSKKQK